MQMTQTQRVLSGMRATGHLHLGHLHGVLKNWINLQYQYECFFFIADWHGLTTHYEHPDVIAESVQDMLIEWLAVGLNPNNACIFLQSQVLQHAELFLLLGMLTPLSWLERVPSYKDQQEKLKQFDLSTYGFLGYPLLQAADILLYKPHWIPVGEDQVSHIEVAREIARRFNFIYGREKDFETLAEAAVQRLGKKSASLYADLRKRYQEMGDQDALEKAQAILAAQPNMTLGDRERLQGYLVGASKIILPEPEALLTEISKMPGLDGQKMSKSYRNTIMLRDPPVLVDEKIRKMPTDPARVKRSDPGEPTKCPVWNFHQLYSNNTTQDWVLQGCRSASIGCLECKKPVIEAISAELAPIQSRIQEYTANPTLVRTILYDGCEKARRTAEETMTEVREAMSFNYAELVK